MTESTHTFFSFFEKVRYVKVLSSSPKNILPTRTTEKMDGQEIPIADSKKNQLRQISLKEKNVFVNVLVFIEKNFDRDCFQKACYYFISFKQGM